MISGDGSKCTLRSVEKENCHSSAGPSTICLSAMSLPTLESAPCPPYFVDNIYDIFVAVAVNQSLTVAEYTTIANNCNIVPSTTTTKATTSSVTTEQSSGTSTPTPTTELSIESTSSFPASTETPPSPSTSTDRLTETTSSPSTSTERLTEATSSPSTSTERLTEITSSPSTSTERSTETTSSPSTSTERMIETSSSPSTSTERLTTIPSSPSTSTERLTETTSSPSTSTERLTESTSSPSTSTKRTTETTSSSSTSTERMIETLSSPSTSTERLTTIPSSPSTSTERLTETTSTPSTSTERLTETTSSPSTSTERSTETTASPSTSTERLTETTSSPSTSTERMIETSSLPSTSTERLTTIPSSPSTSAERLTETTFSPSTIPTSAVPFVTTEQSTVTASSPATTLEETTTDALHTTSLFSPVTPVILAANSCNDVCKVTLGASVSLFLALCILVFIFLRPKQNRKHRTTKYKIHGFDENYHVYSLYDQVMHRNFSRSSSWKSDSSLPFTFYRGHSRSLSDRTCSIVRDREPLHFVNQICLPDIDTTYISETNWQNRRHHLRQSSSLEARQTSKFIFEQSKPLENYTFNSIETHTYKPTLEQSKSLESYTLDIIKQHSSKPTLAQSESLENYKLNRIEQPPRDSIYKRNNKPTKSSIKRKNYRESRSKGCIMGNPYSLEDYDSESSYGSNGPAIYDGPITFTPEFDRRPFPKVPSDIRREMIEQSRDSRRDNTGNQSRRRSRSHDPNLQYGYIERQFSFDLDPDCPGLYRPAGRYKKHNPRQRKVSTASREFNMDNMNRYSSEAEIDNNNYMQYDGYGHNSDGYLNRETNSNLRNRNTEQKVISSILKNGKPPNNRSRSDCSGEGMVASASAADVFDSNRNRSLSHGAATIGETVKTQKPNTIYFYQTKL